MLQCRPNVVLKYAVTSRLMVVRGEGEGSFRSSVYYFPLSLHKLMTQAQQLSIGQHQRPCRVCRIPAAVKGVHYAEYPTPCGHSAQGACTSPAVEPQSIQVISFNLEVNSNGNPFKCSFRNRNIQSLRMSCQVM